MKRLLLLCLLTTLPLAASKTPAQLIAEYNRAGLPGKTRALQNIFTLDPARVPDDEFNEIVTIVTQLQKEGSPIIRSISINAEWDRLIKKAQSARSKEQVTIAQTLADRSAKIGKEREEKGSSSAAAAKPGVLAADAKKFFENALKKHDDSAVFEYIRKHPEVVDQVDEEGHGILLMALWEDKPSLPVIRELIKRMKNIDYVCKHGETPLFHAAAGGNPEIVGLLLARGANVNRQDRFKNTPLMDAMDTQNFETIKLLLKAGADIKTTGTGRLTALHFAIHPEYIFILNPEATKEAEDLERVPPVHQVKTVALLLDSRADIEAQADDLGSPLMTAVGAGNVAVVEYLISRGADIEGGLEREAIHAANPTPIERVVRDRERFLNDQELSPRDKNANLHISMQILQLLAKAGADIQPPFLEAIANGDLAAVKEFIHHGASVRAMVHGGDAVDWAEEQRDNEQDPKKRARLDEIIRLLKNAKNIVAQQRAGQREQKAAAQAFAERRQLPAELESEIMEFVTGPKGSAQMPLERATVLNDIKAAMSRNDLKTLVHILGTPENLDLIDEDGNNLIHLALHYQDKSPYTPGKDNVLVEIVRQANIRDSLETQGAQEPKRVRVPRMMEHRNRQGLTPMELAHKRHLSKQVIDYLKEAEKVAAAHHKAAANK